MKTININDWISSDAQMPGAEHKHILYLERAMVMHDDGGDPVYFFAVDSAIRHEEEHYYRVTDSNKRPVSFDYWIGVSFPDAK